MLGVCWFGGIGSLICLFFKLFFSGACLVDWMGGGVGGEGEGLIQQ